MPSKDKGGLGLKEVKTSKENQIHNKVDNQNQTQGNSR